MLNYNIIPWFSEESVAHVVEVSSEKRSIGGNRKFQIRYDDQHIELDLKPSRGLLPKVLKVTSISTDPNGNEIHDDWTHTVSVCFKLTNKIALIFVTITAGKLISIEMHHSEIRRTIK